MNLLFAVVNFYRSLKFVCRYVVETLGRWVGSYRCASYRHGCKACVTVTIEDEDPDEEEEMEESESPKSDQDKPKKCLKSIWPNNEAHTCPQKVKKDVFAGAAIAFSPSESVQVIDVRAEMKLLAEELALSETKMSSIRIAQQVQDKVERKYDILPYKGLNAHQLQSLVHYTRRKEFADWEGAITSFPLVLCSDDDDRLFLQFNSTINVANSLQKIIGWAHPD